MHVSTKQPVQAPATGATATWATGQVVDRDGEIVYVSLRERVCEARRALGCVVVPEPGDLVAVLCDESHAHHVMQVLQRTGGAPLIWAAPQALTINAPGGLNLRTDATLTVQGSRLEGKVDEVRWWSRLLHFTGVELIARTRLARWVGEVTELLTQRLQVNAQRSYRTVEQAEHVRTGLLDVQARHAVHIRARHALIRAKDLAKVDGAQIHVG
jgi:hypothetical protein